MIQYDFVGLDVSKDKFDAALGDSKSTIFERNKSGLKQFCKWLKCNTTLPWVCMEATGHYSEEIGEYLIAENIKVTIANPMQIKSFCRAKLLRNKNDIVDARAISEYASKMPLREFKTRPDEQKEVNELNKLLETLKRQLVQLENQLESSYMKISKKYLIKSIKELKAKIAEIEKALGELVKKSERLRENFQLMTTIPGIGKLTAYQLLGLISDMDSFENAKQFAAFVGLSPRQNQSGKSAGVTRISKVGNPRLRKSFYMASLSAKRHNPNLQEFVRRLQDNGKAPKAILCAVMRKLAHTVYAVLKRKQPFIAGYNVVV